MKQQPFSIFHEKSGLDLSQRCWHGGPRWRTHTAPETQSYFEPPNRAVINPLL